MCSDERARCQAPASTNPLADTVRRGGAMAAITESVTPPHESRAAHVFDGFLEAAEEPRDMSSPWHEKRRRDILMASLPLRRLGRVLEIGCAGGLVTAELSQR